jgi:hypothetical protein
MPVFWCVTVQGQPLFRGFVTEAEARAKAERWQGERYRTGLLKHGDRGDWVEVKRDTAREREFDRAYELAKRGNPQTYHYEYS